MPSSFLTPLRLEFEDNLKFKLTEPFRFVSNYINRIIDVPAGFVTDFASIPRILWNILPPAGSYGKAAVVHDLLYQMGTVGLRSVTRAEADAILNEAMVVLKVGRLTRWAIYSGVRVGGWLTWNRYRKAEYGSAIH